MPTKNQQYQGVQTRIEAATQELSQISASNQTVAGHASEAATVAASAVEIAETTQSTFAELRTSSDKIGNVIEVIKDVAEQTNLLALNATIEAARAGDAGKGFAVVASEVKELSRQTSQAVDQVNERIAEIQASAHKSIEANNNILDVIDRINGIQDKIAIEITEQDGMTTAIQGELKGALSMVTELLQGR